MGGEGGGRREGNISMAEKEKEIACCISSQMSLTWFKFRCPRSAILWESDAC